MPGDSKTSFHLFVSLPPFSDAQKIKNQLEKIFHRVGRIGKTIIFSENLTGGAGYLGLQTPGFRIPEYCFVRLLEAFVSIPLCNSPSSLSHPTRETMRHANALSCNGKPPVTPRERRNCHSALIIRFVRSAADGVKRTDRGMREICDEEQ